ncbi:MAG TPA: HAD hydrolase-like protein [Clostridia bacterium]|nr:HAD hydrolase-like protein [Clostridia bacterium]
MQYTTVFFDLDGTLIESGPGIYAAARAVLRDMGIPARPDAEMPAMIGPPLYDGFREVLKVPEERVQEALALYREKAKTVGIDLIKPYPGILGLLEALKRAGTFVGVVTSKVTPTANEHLERLGLARHIDLVRGGVPGGGAEKLPILLEALGEVRPVKARCVMVGDRHFDLLAADAAGIPSIGVTYGYGSEAEIASCHPTHTVSSVAALGDLLLHTPYIDRN